MVAVQVAQAIQRMGRTTRTPQHPWALRHRPWNIQPCFIAPVIPGDTLQRILIQSRVVTDPVVDPLTGWWCEFYMFYVKHRDLGIRDELEQMVLDPGWDASVAGVETAAANVFTYHSGAGIDWVEECLKRVTEIYFRNEGEAWNVAVDATTGLPLAKISGANVWDSLLLTSAYQAEDVTLIDAATTDVLTASEVESGMQQWYLARQMGLTDMTYEDFLKQYGVSAPRAEEAHRPELLRFIREWAYPANTIDPTDGSPSSAISWAISERADKNRFLREPGFIFGVTVARPKVFYARQVGSAAWALDTAFKWLPATLMDDPSTSLVSVAAGAGPLGLQDNAYVYDVRDLHVYGEQFVNFSMLSTDVAIAGPYVDRPADADASYFYPIAADIDRPFVGTWGAGTGRVRQDGIAALSIKSATADPFPGRNPGTA